MPQPAPQESIPWWWNPSRPGVKLGPEWFREKLKKEMGEELEVTWNSYLERWCVFMKQPRVRHPIGMGWTLLFVVQDEEKNYLPLDERIFARLYAASQKKWGDGAKYWDAVMREQERDKERAERTDVDNSIQHAMEVFNHSQISVGYGHSNGSKFATYHQ